MKRISYKRKSQVYEQIYEERTNELGFLLTELLTSHPKIIKELLDKGILKDILPNASEIILNATTCSGCPPMFIPIGYAIITEPFFQYYYELEYKRLEKLYK